MKHWMWLLVPLAMPAGASQISISDAVAVEGPAGGGTTVVFTIALDAPPPDPVVAVFSTAGCSAIEGADYEAKNETVYFSVDGRLRQTVAVSIHGDAEPEGIELFTVALTQISGAIPGRTGAWGRILDDDLPRPNPLPRGDRDGDGRSDLWLFFESVKGEPSGKVEVWGGDPPNLTQPDTNPAFPLEGWRPFGFGDFNPQTGWELIWQGSSGELLVGNDILPPSVSALSGPTPTPVGAHERLVGSAELGAGSELDLLVWDEARRELRAWVRVGDTYVHDPTIVLPPALEGAHWRPVATPDLDGDGSMDVLWYHQGTLALLAWRMQGNVLLESLALDPAQVGNSGWSVVATGDFDGDGHDDLVWQHDETHRLVLWLMEGARRICGGFTIPDKVDRPGYRWEVIGPR
ncbi:MAG: hypothetical protein HC897_03615 [Thermoanaerobaculia bacterium]|nr:hypothetical protein [Thermoanaerobaculia bacterium]